MNSMTEAMAGLSRNLRLSLQVLGQRGSRLVVDASGIPTKTIAGTDMVIFPINAVFDDPQAVFLGFGKPNVYLTVPRGHDDPKGPGWNKFAAFMLWRAKSYVADTKGRVQAGVLMELRGLPEEAKLALRREMQKHAGHRTPSCAHVNSLVLAAAGFTCGGDSLAKYYRPSKLASTIWQRGLEYEGVPVEMRMIQTGPAVADHFLGVWNKELISLCRAVIKQFERHLVKNPAPVFIETQVEESGAVEVKSAHTATIGISRPSKFGVWLSFIFGERPIFSAKLDTPMTDPSLSSPIESFPGMLSLMTKVKKNILFSKPVIWLIRSHVAQVTEYYEGMPAKTIANMLRLSESSDRKTAFVYNLVITGSDIRITRLENRNGRDKKFINWMLAKHVLVSGYDPDVRYAGEVWCSKEEDGTRLLHLNDNSGTYRPAGRIAAVAQYLSEVFEVPVNPVAFDPSA